MTIEEFEIKNKLENKVKNKEKVKVKFQDFSDNSYINYENNKTDIFTSLQYNVLKLVDHLTISIGKISIQGFNNIIKGNKIYNPYIDLKDSSDNMENKEPGTEGPSTPTVEFPETSNKSNNLTIPAEKVAPKESSIQEILPVNELGPQLQLPLNSSFMSMKLQQSEYEDSNSTNSNQENPENKPGNSSEIVSNCEIKNLGCNYPHHHHHHHHHHHYHCRHPHGHHNLPPPPAPYQDILYPCMHQDHQNNTGNSTGNISSPHPPCLIHPIHPIHPILHYPPFNETANHGNENTTDPTTTSNTTIVGTTTNFTTATSATLEDTTTTSTPSTGVSDVTSEQLKTEKRNLRSLYSVGRQ
ncbi:hypothetical protein HWI79_1930 [Cryptosporidium felis]|nr:hypothetical protein HWI79_1930 [Cryptosporidium felis]